MLNEVLVRQKVGLGRVNAPPQITPSHCNIFSSEESFFNPSLGRKLVVRYVIAHFNDSLKTKLAVANVSLP